MATPRGAVNRLNKKLDNIPVAPSQGGNTQHARNNESLGTIIEGINKTGVKLEPYMCIAVMPNPGGSNLPPWFEFVGQTEEPDAEDTLIGSVQETILDDDIGHILVSGEAIYKYAIGDEYAYAGSRAYPCKYEEGGENNGKVAIKDNGLEVYNDIILGKILDDEEEDADLVRVAQGIGGGAGATGIYCRSYIDDITDFDSNPTPDGVTLVEGDKVLVTIDDVDIDGVYVVDADLLYQPETLIADMDLGQLISVFEGDSSPLLYMKVVDDIEEV